MARVVNFFILKSRVVLYFYCGPFFFTNKTMKSDIITTRFDSMVMVVIISHYVGFPLRNYSY